MIDFTPINNGQTEMNDESPVDMRPRERNLRQSFQTTINNALGAFQGMQQAQGQGLMDPQLQSQQQSAQGY